MFVFVIGLLFVLSSAETVADIARSSTCGTHQIEGLAGEVVELINLKHPGLMVDISKGVYAGKWSMSRSVHPFLQKSTADALLRVVAARPGHRLTINSALRTVPQQVLLKEWKRRGGRCAPSAQVATPGRSNHHAGIAVDVNGNAGWRRAFQSNGFRWGGNGDKPHFEFSVRKFGQQCIRLFITNLFL